jgi:hypothetical protein
VTCPSCSARPCVCSTRVGSAVVAGELRGVGPVELSYFGDGEVHLRQGSDTVVLSPAQQQRLAAMLVVRHAEWVGDIQTAVAS